LNEKWDITGMLEEQCQVCPVLCGRMHLQLSVGGEQGWGDNLGGYFLWEGLPHEEKWEMGNWEVVT